MPLFRVMHEPYFLLVLFELDIEKFKGMTKLYQDQHRSGQLSKVFNNLCLLGINEIYEGRGGVIVLKILREYFF